eukprot:2010826-Rhodomonas_salina.1
MSFTPCSAFSPSKTALQANCTTKSASRHRGTILPVQQIDTAFAANRQRQNPWTRGRVAPGGRCSGPKSPERRQPAAPAHAM